MLLNLLDNSKTKEVTAIEVFDRMMPEVAFLRHVIFENYEGREEYLRNYKNPETTKTYSGTKSIHARLSKIEKRLETLER